MTMLHSPEKQIHIIKRDGRTVPFNAVRIASAIGRAMQETEAGLDEFLAVAIANKILSECKAMDGIPTVELVQDMVESNLMSSDRKDVAKQYILYRAERSRQRDLRNTTVQQIREKTSGKSIDNANANVDEHTFGGRKNEAAGILQKNIALEYNMDADVAEAHKGGLIYQHDLDHYNVGAHNCLFIDFKKLFTEGFATRNCDVRPPTSFSTACQLVAVAMQLQSQCQYGGVASAHIDTDLAPYVAMSFKRHHRDGMKYIYACNDDEIEEAYATLFDNVITIDNQALLCSYSDAYTYAKDMLEREGMQAAQALWHNLGTLESRAGAQVPFSSLNYGRDTTAEGKLVTRWFLQASIEGVGKHHTTSIFPISIFSYKKGVNAAPGDPNYREKLKSIESMSIRIFPNWCNGDWSEAHEDPNDPDTIFSTMGCRTLIGYDRNGLGYTRVGRGNNTPITIILPKLGIEYGICRGERTEPDLKGFWAALESTLQMVERAHLKRFEIMKTQSPKAAPFMYQNGTIKDADKCQDDVSEALKHGSFAFGFIGIAEMCQALFGKSHVYDREVWEFAYSVVRRINLYAQEFSERNNLNGSCYATPAENLCFTAMKKLRDQYGIIPNVTEREYLTNSHHVPVWEKVGIYEKLRIEAPFTKLCTGGTITYIECDSSLMSNHKAVEDIIDYAFQKLDIPYLAFNFPLDTCNDCGFQSEFDSTCPECGSENITQLRRVTGYLSSDYRRFNHGKQTEVCDRVRHTIDSQESYESTNCM